MNIHEYQAKALLKEFGAPVSNGVAIFKASEAKAAAKKQASAAARATAASSSASSPPRRCST